MPPLHSQSPEFADEPRKPSAPEPEESANESRFRLELTSRSTEELRDLKKALEWRIRTGNGTPESSIPLLADNIAQIDSELAREERQESV